MSRETIGLIGLGLLGSALAERLLAGGFAVLGYDCNPAQIEAHRARGGMIAETPSQVVGGGRRLLFSLPTTAIVRQVLAEILPSLSPGHLLIDTTTGEPEASEEIGGMLLARGVPYLDATVVGSSADVRRGEGVVLCGGDAVAFETCRDLLASFSQQAFHLGGSGSGARMKLVVNLALGLHRAVLAEALGFAQAFGFDPAVALAVLKSGAAASRVMETKGEKMVRGEFAPQARLAQHLKDVRLILASAETQGARTPLSQLHSDLLEEAVSAGLADADNSAIARLFLSFPAAEMEDQPPAS